LRSLSITRVVFTGLLLITMAVGVVAEPSSAKLNEMLPKVLGKFHRLPSMRPLVSLAREGILNPDTFRARTDPATSLYVGAETEYLSAAGETLTIEILGFTGDSDAYSFLTLLAKKMQEAEPAKQISPAGVGTASVKSSRSVAFFKGTTFVRVTQADSKSRSSDSAVVLARLLADRLDNGEGDVPVLLKHLPDWENARTNAVYVVSSQPLKNQFGNQAVMNAVSFEGGTEAVAAHYGSSQMVIVEFTTPQLAGDNDRRIVEKIHELWNQGQPAPTAYRRVGNYSVFVFNAPNDQTAKQLIDQVKYEQVVQWLGDNPNWLKDAQRQYTETTLGVFVSVVKASGVAAVLCFGIGGFFGALLFARRRAQQKSAEAYSDAGGMMRLNLDEMSAELDRGKLIGSGMSDKL
jgi:hypothetical protein